VSDNPAAAPPDTDADKKTVVEVAVEHSIDLSACLVWDGEHTYLVAQEHGHVRTFAVRSAAFKRWLIARMRDHGVKPPSNPAQWQAIRDLLDSRAERDGVQPTPSIRVAGRDGFIYIDLGDDAWNCVKVTKDGWTVIPHPADGPYFYRPPRMAALPLPEPGGTVEGLLAALNAEGTSSVSSSPGSSPPTGRAAPTRCYPSTARTDRPRRPATRS
jgi:hypothetical protein